jgi:hypothetical protein
VLKCLFQFWHGVRPGYYSDHNCGCKLGWNHKWSRQYGILCPTCTCEHGSARGIDVRAFFCINEHSNFKAIWSQFLSEVFQVYHRLFVSIDLDSCSLIVILCSVLLLECRGVTRIMIVTNSIDCNDGKLFVFLANTDVTLSSAARRIFSRP